jgi:hypothetical protein
MSERKQCLGEDDGQTGSYSESEGSLGHSGLLSPGLSRNRKLEKSTFPVTR